MILCPKCGTVINDYESLRTLWRSNKAVLEIDIKDNLHLTINGYKLRYNENEEYWIGLVNGKLIKLEMPSLKTVVATFESILLGDKP